MSLALLAVGYLAVGGLLAVAILVAKRPTATDTFLVAVLWPLYAPFVLLYDGGSASDDPGEETLRAALARAASSPLGSLLPDAESARVLARRLREATERLAELEAVLARPDFDPAATQRRAAELAAHGATAAAATAQLRVRMLEQLRGLRQRYRHELDEVSELIAQLVAQAELVRLDPQASSAARELVRELVERVEGLDGLYATLHGEAGENVPRGDLRDDDPVRVA